MSLIIAIATPLVYGWLTGDARGAVVTGTLPFILVTILVAAFNPLDLFTPGRIGQVLIFLLPLTLIGGLIGFFHRDGCIHGSASRSSACSDGRVIFSSLGSIDEK